MSKTEACNIKHYISDGFQKVCDVKHRYQKGDNEWYYFNINQDLMYDNHKSWIYFIVNDKKIFKVGETGNPLGIRKTKDNWLREVQPLKATTNRFGRLASMPDRTDGRIRTELKESVHKGLVSLWARRCEIKVEKILIAGKMIPTAKTFHKELEMQYLDYMAANGYWPVLNQLRK